MKCSNHFFCFFGEKNVTLIPLFYHEITLIEITFRISAFFSPCFRSSGNRRTEEGKKRKKRKNERTKATKRSFVRKRREKERTAAKATTKLRTTHWKRTCQNCTPKAVLPRARQGKSSRNLTYCPTKHNIFSTYILPVCIFFFNSFITFPRVHFV